MRILFDVEMEGNPNKRTVSPMIAEMMEALRDFIKGRLIVFSDQMKLQEDRFGSFVYIELLNKSGPSWGFIEYVPSFKKKMHSVFTEKDWKYISLKLSEISQNFLN